jgi:hypothetical protein
MFTGIGKNQSEYCVNKKNNISKIFFSRTTEPKELKFT